MACVVVVVTVGDVRARDVVMHTVKYHTEGSTIPAVVSVVVVGHCRRCTCKRCSHVNSKVSH